ncbi:hypothetical protein U9M48_005532 [Paspalum notatum var. saurae]|uniref:Reverse transcriptase domain-containing protein n=1 Tax=Paspalum notatum var. saurae TaxID=547442 RepID=A0AAQ3SLU8_PASNO
MAYKMLIGLLNVSFKIFTKVASNRMIAIADKVVSPSQTTFMRSFSSKWISWAHSFITGGSVAVNVNMEVMHFFQTRKSLRQGDPLFLLLFNLVADMLAVLQKREDQIEGVIPHLVDGGLSILQFADDTILFLDHNLESAQNLKLILCAFEQVSGLKINIHKSQLFCFGPAQNSIDQYTNIFGCKTSDFPLCYLGIPIHYKKLRNAD